MLQRRPYDCIAGSAAGSKSPTEGVRRFSKAAKNSRPLPRGISRQRPDYKRASVTESGCQLCRVLTEAPFAVQNREVCRHVFWTLGFQDRLLHGRELAFKPCDPILEEQLFLLQPMELFVSEDL
jgi:hypothetical protein